MKSLLLRVRDAAEARLFPTVLAGNPAGRTLALTFDDGPTPGVTDRIGELLASRGHRATFFVLVPRALANADLIRELAAQGHEIALHGLRHERLVTRSGRQVREDLVLAARQLEGLGLPRVRLMRPPFGAQSRVSFLATRRAGLKPVGWTAEIGDFGEQDRVQILERLEGALRPGAIVLLHDAVGDHDQPMTAVESALKIEVVERAVGLLEERGLCSDTVSGLLSSGARHGRWIRGVRAGSPPVSPGETLHWPGANDGVSAVIAHYGDPALAGALVDDLLSQRGASVQVIVADDASPRPFPEREGVTVVRRPSNGGFGSAINSGVAEATEPWLFVLNSDIRLDEDFLAKALCHAALWQPAMCGFRQLGQDGEQPASGRFPTLISMAALHTGTFARVVARRGWSIWTERQPASSGQVDWLVGSGLLLPRALFEAVGGFDSRYFLYMEEVDLQRRLRLAGVPSVLILEVAFRHDHGSSSHSVNMPLHLLRSRLQYVEKWEGPARRRLLEWMIRAGIVLDLLANVARRVAGRDVHPLTAARLRGQRLKEARRERRTGS